MTLEGSQSFAKVIEEHLELKRRNSGLEGDMPIDRYRSQDPFQNHPLFKSEEQARLEETLSGTEPISVEEELVLAWPAGAGEETDPTLAQTDGDGNLWSRSRDFDWGD
jgi:hypothetical protein